MGLWNRLSETTNKSENLQIMLEEIENLSDPQDMPRKIVMLQHTLSLVQRQSSQELWSFLHLELGFSLIGNPQGSRDYNIEKAIEHFNKTLEVYTPQDFPREWAISQSSLASAYHDRIMGNRAENIEQAIEHYNNALEVYTSQNFPKLWAETQNCLAVAYCNRIRGNRAMNLEQAIVYYQSALKVYTYQDFPIGWADTHNNLGNAYCGLIREDWAENIEKGIEHYNYALKVRTLHDFPVDWAQTQNNLAIAYFDRIGGDRAENIEQAIKRYIQILDIYTYQDYPTQWARTQNNLANAYMIRIQGDRAENIEQAIKHYNQALKVRTSQNFSVQWAMTQSNLANAYLNRIRDSRADNIEKAIYHYNQALKVRTKHDFPLDWARSQSNLASAYTNRIVGNQAENIEQAIEYYNKALEVYTLQDFPVDWAKSLNGLASAYAYRTIGNRAENIEQAIEYYEMTLKVYTPQNFPVDWATIQNNLANAYINRILGDKAKNIENAITHLDKTLDVYKLGLMPEDFRRTCTLLGNLYFDMGQWKDALGSYINAIKAGNLLYRSDLSNESKTTEIKENAYIYQNASLAACRFGLAKEALFILDEGKIRLLSESLRLRMKQPEGVPKEEWEKYKAAAEKYSSATKLSNQEDYAQREKRAQEALKELDNAVRVIQGYTPKFLKELDILDIFSILDAETALIAFCITDKGSIGFVVSRSNGVQSVDIPNFKAENLNSLLFQTDKQRRISGGWIGHYLSYVDSIGTENYDDTFQSWQRTLNYVLSTIGTDLLGPLLSKLPYQIKRLILLPSGGLFLLPLHSIPLPDGQLLCQRYCISYTPSLQLLKELHNKNSTDMGKGLYAVINPEEDPALVFSIYEGQAISKLFESSHVNVAETGTKATVLNMIPGWAYLHFSCHGSYNWNDPPQSGLYLVGERTLSLEDLQNNVVDMSSARLVTLSACETGIIDIIHQGIADEFVGLPAGFMLAGVPCVVSSLWSVPDISTALLMERFYSNHISRGMDIPMALQDAQLWVRDLIFSEVADYVEKCYHAGKWEGESKDIIEQYRERYHKMAEKSPEEKPFQHPYYWAAFTVNGA